MRSDANTAAVKALALLKLWNFPNSYTLGKRFTELLVNNIWDCLQLLKKGSARSACDNHYPYLCRRTRWMHNLLPAMQSCRQVRDFSPRLSPARVVIARPSFIGAVAGAPCPGYVGNLAGNELCRVPVSGRQHCKRRGPLPIHSHPPPPLVLLVSSGPAGFAVAFGMGFFQPGTVAWHDNHMIDCVPVRGNNQVTFISSVQIGVISQA